MNNIKIKTLRFLSKIGIGNPINMLYATSDEIQEYKELNNSIKKEQERRYVIGFDKHTIYGNDELKRVAQFVETYTLKGAKRNVKTFQRGAKVYEVKEINQHTL